MSRRDLVYICEICGTILNEHHCKAICPNCGRMFDCSDLPLIQANAAIDDVEGLVLPPGGDASVFKPDSPESVPETPPDV